MVGTSMTYFAVKKGGKKGTRTVNYPTAVAFEGFKQVSQQSRERCSRSVDYCTRSSLMHGAWLFLKIFYIRLRSMALYFTLLASA